MSQNSAEHGYFLSALDTFVTRTCYANAGGKVMMDCSYKLAHLAATADLLLICVVQMQAA